MKTGLMEMRLSAIKATMILVSVLVTLFCLLLSEPVLAWTGDATAVTLSAALECTQTDMVLTLTIRNVGNGTLDIRDLPVFFAGVGPGGPQPLGALFVSPAPGFDLIPPGEESTFALPFSREGEPEAAEYRLIIVGVEVFFTDAQKPVIRHFTFAPCI